MGGFEMGSIPPELSLEIRPPFVPRTIGDFIRELTAIGGVAERVSRFDDLIKRLEEEMKKIDAFKRELPLCMLLLNDAISTLKEELALLRARNVEPVLEEFIPIKRNCDEGEHIEAKKENDSKDKMNWMSSVQLWNTSDGKSTNSNCDLKQNSAAPVIKGVEEIKSKAFVPFTASSIFSARKEDNRELPVSGLSLVTPGMNNPGEEVGSCGLNSKTSRSRKVPSSTPNCQSNLRVGLQHQASRKQRRCWSPELHRRFISALQQLGGSQVATPKQIRELMQVDGLTNDEVKSHLQKFRLHIRRVPGAAVPANQRMITSGGLWMAQDQYSESSKLSIAESHSPPGPLQLAGTDGGISTTMEEEDDEEEGEERSDNYSWKSHIHKSGKVDVQNINHHGFCR